MTPFYANGIYLPEIDLWLDPRQPRRRAIVSHAHSDHTAGHDETWCTTATAALMRTRLRSAGRFRELGFGQPVAWGDATVALHPAGHILGSAQVAVARDGCRLLYSGDFKLRVSRTAEPIDVPETDLLVLETTYARPHYRFPPAEEVVASIGEWCRTVLEREETPILFCYALGKGQELLACLGELGVPIALHRAHAEMAAIYRALGVALPDYTVHAPGAPIPGVLIAPPQSRRAQWFQALAGVRTAFVSGWAADAGTRWRMGVDACFPLSDHADYGELLEYVERSGAKRVFTVHGFAHEFALDLRLRGLDATALPDAPAQLALF